MTTTTLPCIRANTENENEFISKVLIYVNAFYPAARPDGRPLCNFVFSFYKHKTILRPFNHPQRFSHHPLRCGGNSLVSRVLMADLAKLSHPSKNNLCRLPGDQRFCWYGPFYRPE